MVWVAGATGRSIQPETWPGYTRLAVVPWLPAAVDAAALLQRQFGGEKAKTPPLTSTRTSPSLSSSHLP